MAFPKAIAAKRQTLKIVREMPKISLDNLYKDKEKHPITEKERYRKKGKYKGFGHKGAKYLPVIGWSAGPTFYDSVPSEPYNKDYFKRREYPPFSLHKLQRMIDLGRIDPLQPVDLTALCNTRTFLLDVANRHYGFQLTDEGADSFVAKINLEVQHVASEVAIAAIERNGGTILSRFYDPPSLFALRDPEKFFSKGMPIPRCALPPQDAIEYYIDPKNRGYLADPKEIAKARLETAQKYGYRLPDLNSENSSSVVNMLLQRKDARQIFYGLSPGWVVNLKDKTILKPKDQELVDFYAS